MQHPIKRRAHGAIDYGLTALNLAGPLALGLKGPARVLPMALAAAQGGLTALTDQPLAVKRLVAFPTHGAVDAATLPLAAVAAWRTGALAEPRSRIFFGGLFTALGAVFALTDWKAKRKS
jgi:hypothetical protein